MDPSARRSGGSGSGSGSGSGDGGGRPPSSLDFPNLPTTISLTPILSSTPDQTIPPPPPTLSRYESQKRRDWNTFLHYLQNHKPPLSLPRCSGAHVIEFLRYLDQFGKTKVHSLGCAFFGHPSPPGPCACPLRQAWGSLDALIGRLRAAYDESGGIPDTNPFASRAVRFYLRDVRDSQAKARGIPYHKKKRKRPLTDAAVAESSSSRSDVGLDEVQGSTSTGGAEAGGRSSSSSSAS